MSDTGKGIVIGSLILGASMIVSVVLILGAAQQAQNTMVHYAAKVKKEAMDILRSQKHQFRKFEWDREVRMRNFVRDELRKLNIEAKVAAAK